MTDLAQRLTDTERERRWPNVRPKDAATLILLDRRAATPKVLMGRRHAGHKFMPGKFVFPGGRVDGVDHRMEASGALHPDTERRLVARHGHRSATRARAIALAAIRETFEETGLLLGRAATDIKAPPGVWADFAGHGVSPLLDNLQLIARAITPPRRPRRFDARFFVADAVAIAHRVENVVGQDSELVELVWVPLPEARALELPAVTSVVLDELDTRLAGGMAPEMPVPFYYESHRRWRRDEL